MALSTLLKIPMPVGIFYLRTFSQNITKFRVIALLRACTSASADTCHADRRAIWKPFPDSL